jgi:hypothetical protein
MKQIKFWSILLLTVILFVVSCGDGDDTTGDVNNGQSTGSHYGHAWVDLGLSVRWATCNVGASQPHESGNYFAWGETTGYNEGKRNFSAKTYKWYDEGVGYTKYNSTDFDPIDGRLVRICDHFSALMEADISIKHGITSEHLTSGREGILSRYAKNEIISGINVNEFFQNIVAE